MSPVTSSASSAWRPRRGGPLPRIVPLPPLSQAIGTGDDSLVAARLSDDRSPLARSAWSSLPSCRRPGFPDDQIDLWVPARTMPMVGVFDPTRDFRRFRFVARLQRARARGRPPGGERVLHEIAPGVSGRSVSVRRLDEEMVGSARPVLGAFLAGAPRADRRLRQRGDVAHGPGAVRNREFAVRLAIGADRGRLVRTRARRKCGDFISLICRGPLDRASDARRSGAALRRQPAACGHDRARRARACRELCHRVGRGARWRPGARAGRSAERRRVVLRLEALTTTGGGHRVRAPLVVAQLALTVLLLTGAGLFGRTAWRLWTTDIGASRDHVLTARLALTETARFDAESRERFVNDLLREVRRFRASGGGTRERPAPSRESDRDDRGSWTIRAATTARHEPRAVTPGYFRALGMPIRRGREFDDATPAPTRPLP